MYASPDWLDRFKYQNIHTYTFCGLLGTCKRSCTFLLLLDGPGPVKVHIAYTWFNVVMCQDKFSN
jgi:hypothetical protein